MIEKVLKNIQENNLVQNGDKVIATVSGGPDSICMLDILLKIKNTNKIKFDLVVAHVNHQIREEADSDQKYVEDFCEKNQIKCFSKRIDVINYANNSKIGLEEAGRILRYDFFEEIIKNENFNKIAIAHNKNDKIETIIMNILRGSGLNGLKGIEPIRDNKYIRPLIDCQRDEIENYCKDNKLEPRIDKTNFDNEYTRNKIRNIVIPFIKKEFNPNIIETISRLSNVVSETEEYLQKETTREFNNIKVEENPTIILDLKKFNQKDSLIKNRILLYSISKTLGNVQNVEKINLEDIIKMCNNNIGNKYLMPNKNIKIYINHGKIFFIAIN